MEGLEWECLQAMIVYYLKVT